MRTLIVPRYGPPDVLQVVERPLPTPRPHEILVRVWAAGLNPKDALMRKGRMSFLVRGRFPYVPSYDLAGEVVAVGRDGGRWGVGQAIYGMINNFAAGGACAEYATLSAREVAPKPANLDWVQAAAVPLAALTSLQALRDLGRLQPGQRVCINGASGGVGTLAVQIAKALGAQVTAVCSHRNTALMYELGADEVVDYTQEVLEQSGRQFDIFYDVFGNKSIQQVRPLLAPRAIYVSTKPRPHLFAQHLLTVWSRQQVKVVVVRSNTADLETLTQFVEAGQLRPILDSTYPLASAAAAHQRIETRRARGKIVITMNNEQ